MSKNEKSTFTFDEIESVLNWCELHLGAVVFKPGGLASSFVTELAHIEIFWRQLARLEIFSRQLARIEIV